MDQQILDALERNIGGLITSLGDFKTALMSAKTGQPQIGRAHV